MDRPRPRPATYADIEALPETLVGEIVHGVLYTHPRPAPRHGQASSSLGYELIGPFDRGRGGPGGWIFIDEPELHLGAHVLVPDIAGWRRERLPTTPATAYFETPPAWVCKVLSPSTVRLDRTSKLAIYGACKVGHAWYVDPIARMLEVFELTPSSRWSIAAAFADADQVIAPPFEAHAFALDVLWWDR